MYFEHSKYAADASIVLFGSSCKQEQNYSVKILLLSRNLLGLAPAEKPLFLKGPPTADHVTVDKDVQNCLTNQYSSPQQVLKWMVSATSAVASSSGSGQSTKLELSPCFLT